jgi:hypothetical protein
MNRLIRLVSAGIAILLFSIVFFVIPANAEPTYPTNIAGIPVIFVETPANANFLTSNQTNLILLDSSSSTLQDALNKSNLLEYLKNNPLPAAWSFDLLLGSGSSKDSFLENLKIANDLFQKYGPLKISPIGSIEKGPIYADSKLAWRNPPHATTNVSATPDEVNRGASFASDSNDDTSLSNITREKVNITVPYVGTAQDEYSYFGLNGMTDGPWPDPDLQHPFIQSGQVYYNGLARNVWADNETGLILQDFLIDCYPGDACTYEVDIYGSTYLFMGCTNTTRSQSNFHPWLGTNLGTHLIQDPNTSVFFENHNKSIGWNAGFTNPINASGAQEWVDPTGWQNWGTDTRAIYDTFHGIHTNSGQISGSLTYGGTVSWNPNLLYTSFGSLLHVQTDPAIKTQVSVDNLARDEWGLTYVNLPPGTRSLDFSGVLGYSPATIDYRISYDQGDSYTTWNTGLAWNTWKSSIPLADNGITDVVVHFAQAATIRVETNPNVPATIYVDKIAIDSWGFWTCFPPGIHVVSFQNVVPYPTKPPPITITSVAGANIHIIGDYLSGLSFTIVP